MSDDNTNQWADPKKKNQAVFKVLRYLADHPDEGADLVGRDDKARQLFEAIGGIRVPVEDDARVLFFPPGERELEVGSSVILEIPSEDAAKASDEDLKKYVLGNYEYWPVKP
jgi:hypothetical protein